MPYTTPTVFISGVTGSQGGALARQLRMLDWGVHGIVRKIGSPGPKIRRYSEVRDKGTWTISMTAESQLALIDHVDVAKFAVAAFRDPEKFHGQAIGLASELLTIQETLDRLSEAAGWPFKAVYMTDEEIEATRSESKVFANSQVAIRFMADYINMEELAATTPLTTARAFLEREKKGVEETYA